MSIGVVRLRGIIGVKKRIKISKLNFLLKKFLWNVPIYSFECEKLIATEITWIRRVFRVKIEFEGFRHAKMILWLWRNIKSIKKSQNHGITWYDMKSTFNGLLFGPLMSFLALLYQKLEAKNPKDHFLQFTFSRKITKITKMTLYQDINAPKWPL